MKFRRLYWVTEQLGADGTSEVAGVFTSIPDLIERGLQWCDGIDKRHSLRLTLVALDSRKKPLHSWTLPEIGGVEEDLGEYVKTQEFSPSEVGELVGALKGFTANV